MNESAMGKRKTILVVDDTEMVLKAVVAVLERANFLVLHASNGADALQIGSSYTGPIDLLLSDIKMPLMSGPDLGEALKKLRPEMHAMFMSGFSGGDLLILNYGWTYIQKPFVPGKLVEIVSSVLRTTHASNGSHDLETSNSSIQSSQATGK